MYARKSKAEKYREREFEESCVTLRGKFGQMGDVETIPRSIEFTGGRPVDIETNCYQLRLRDDIKIYQYDVTITPEVLGVNQVTHFVYSALCPDGGPRGENEKWNNIIFDGQHILYSSEPDMAGEYTVPVSKDSPDKTVVVKVVQAKEVSSDDREQMLAIYSTAFHKAYRERGLKSFRRKWIDERDQRRAGDFYIIGGFVPTICSLQGGLSYIIDTACRIDREGTLYEFLREAIHKPERRDGKLRSIQALDVQTIHRPNKPRSIKVTGIDWNRTPSNTVFTWKDKKTQEEKSITIAEYFMQAYGYQCKSDDVMIEMRIKRGDREDCNWFPSSVLKISGITEAERRDYNIMRDIATATRFKADEKKRRLDDFVAGLMEDKATSQFFERWGCEIGSSRKLKGRIIQPPKLQMSAKGRGGVTDIVLDQKLGWQREIKNYGLYHVSRFRSPCLIVASSSSRNLVNQVVDGFMKVSDGLNVRIPGFEFAFVDSYHENAFKQKIAQYCHEKQIPSFVFVMLPDADKNRYSSVKSFLTVDIGLPSQMALERTIRGKRNSSGVDLSVITNIVIQIASKTGGIPYRVSPAYMSAVHTMVMGLSLLSNRYGAPVCAATASRDQGFTQFYSDSDTTERGENVIPDSFLESFTRKALEKYKKENDEYPQRVVVYRDGVSYGQMPKLKKEVYAIEEVLNKVTESTVCLTYIIAQKHCSIKILNASNPRSSVCNADAGTVVTEGIGVQDVAEFYMISHYANQGSASPTRYTIIHHSPVLWEDDKLILMTHYQCLQYPNWCGAIRIPACLMLASKLAETSLQYLGSERANENLRDFLHYL